MKKRGALRGKLLAGAMLLGGVLGLVGLGGVATAGVYCPDGTRANSLDGCSSVSGATDNWNLNDTVVKAINVVIGLVGLVAVAAVVVGGFSYSTSHGDASKVNKAKDTIIYGVIGAIVAALAWAIVNYFVSAVFSGGGSSSSNSSSSGGASGGGQKSSKPSNSSSSNTNSNTSKPAPAAPSTPSNASGNNQQNTTSNPSASSGGTSAPKTETKDKNTTTPKKRTTRTKRNSNASEEPYIWDAIDNKETDGPSTV